MDNEEKQQKINEMRARARRIPLRYKLLLSLVSLLLVVGLTEAGMRVVGAVYFSEHDFVARTRPDGERGPTVLCVGDSFTWGGRGERRDSYPAQLGRYLDKTHGELGISVINRGVCEANSRSVRNRLPAWLDQYRPDVLILLTGATNRFNAWNFGGRGGPGPQEESWLRSLRVVKMLEIIWVHGFATFDVIERAFSPHTPISNPNSRFSRFNIYQGTVNRMERLAREEEAGDDPLKQLWQAAVADDANMDQEPRLKALAAGVPDQAAAARALAHFYFLRGRHDLSEKVLEQALAADPDNEELKNALAHYLREWAEFLFQSSKFDEVVGVCLKAIALDPLEYYNYYRLTKVYELQSRYDSATIRAGLDKILAEHPEVGEIPWFQTYRRIFQDKRGWEEGVNAWMRGDVAAIHAMCKKRGIKLILQTYPVRYPMANGVLRSYAEQHKLPLVDNLALFETLTPRSTYVLDDDHCTATGHHKMALNVARVLLRELGHAQAAAAVEGVDPAPAAPPKGDAPADEGKATGDQGKATGDQAKATGDQAPAPADAPAAPAGE